jgi:sugar phosphate isomerase/epimerase
MQLVYAFRRENVYPHQGAGMHLPGGTARAEFLRRSKDVGFDGLELGAGGALNDDAIPALRSELEDAGLPCLAVRGGGGFTHPRTHEGSKESLKNAVRYAAKIGASVVNTVLGTPARDPSGPGSGSWGEAVCQGSSRTATHEDFDRTAAGILPAARLGGDLGVDISIEVHQHSIVDNSWSALRLLGLLDQPNVGVNPDLGNVLWTYDVPEESCEDAIVALAPHTKYWHCKNLYRVNVPDLQRSIFLQVSLPEGEIDYRFALSALRAANYSGHVAVEGIRLGDQFRRDRDSAEYMRALLNE